MNQSIKIGTQKHRNKTIVKGKEHTVFVEISPLETKEPIMNSKAARSPILDSIARFNRFAAVSAGFFLIYIVMNASSTAA